MPYISQIAIIPFSSITVVTGVILDSVPLKSHRVDFISNLKNVFSSYHKPVLKNAPITIVVEEKRYNLTTTDKGVFNLEIEYVINTEPEIAINFDNNKLLIQQDYPVFFKDANTNFGIISDIDDTILISHTSNLIKRVGVLSLVPPQKRKTIDFTQRLLSLISLKDSSVFYVSKSESNLFNLLSTFIQTNDLPKGVLMLTPYLNYSQLFKGKKGKYFKLNNIQFILNNSESKKFILFGDDTQMDMEVYRIIANDFKNRILRIYIRQTKKKINSRKQLLWNKLKDSFPDSIYFNENTDIEKELLIIEQLMSKQE